MTARLFLGIFEAGMFPGCLFLISAWYRRHELLTRMSWFMVSNDIAGTISGLLGAGLGSLNGGGYGGWSWIFFVEGAFTCAAAIVAFFFIPDFPRHSSFLKAEEKEWVVRRLDADSKKQQSKADDKSARTRTGRSCPAARCTWPCASPPTPSRFSPRPFSPRSGGAA